MITPSSLVKVKLKSGVIKNQSKIHIKYDCKIKIKLHICKRNNKILFL